MLQDVCKETRKREENNFFLRVYYSDTTFGIKPHLECFCPAAIKVVKFKMIKKKFHYVKMSYFVLPKNFINIFDFFF